MSYKFAVAAAALLTAVSTKPCAAQVSSADLKDFPNIASAQWKDYKTSYPSSRLCKKDEITLWTCHGKGKTYSLCSSHDITTATGYIQYRVGNGYNVTFKVPTVERVPLGVFTYVIDNANAWVSFHSGGYDYTLGAPLRAKSWIWVSTASGAKGGTGVDCREGNQSLTLNYTIKLMTLAGIGKP